MSQTIKGMPSKFSSNPRDIAGACEYASRRLALEWVCKNVELLSPWASYSALTHVQYKSFLGKPKEKFVPRAKLGKLSACIWTPKAFSQLSIVPFKYEHLVILALVNGELVACVLLGNSMNFFRVYAKSEEVLDRALNEMPLDWFHTFPHGSPTIKNAQKWFLNADPRALKKRLLDALSWGVV